MPGVPYEMKAMTTNTVIPWLKEKFELPVIVHKMVYTQGIPESQLAEKLEDWENNLPNTIKLAYLPSPGRVKLRLSSIGNNKDQLETTINLQIEKVKKIIGKHIFSLTEDELQVVIGELLRKKNATLSTAESCTGCLLYTSDAADE